MPKPITPKDAKPTCYHCKIPIREVMFAYWVGDKIHCSASCAQFTKDKYQGVNRWKQFHSFKSAG